MTREKLKEVFFVALSNVWDLWNSSFPESKTDPFKDPEEILETDTDNDVLRVFYADLHYVMGVHDALGWDLHDPRGPKEWSPHNK